MRRYETVFIVSPNTSDQETNEIVSLLEQVIIVGNGNIVKTDRWGKRKLSYPIEKFEIGQYFLFFYDAEGALVKELERKMRMHEKIIRFLTVRSESGQMPIQPTDSDFHVTGSAPRAEEKGEENSNENNKR
ncbi:MAG: 30S ribosomal protein S6 [Acidobacteriota bacterium]